jgi:hypothetical protein
MAKNWGVTLAEKGASWNMPPAEITELAALATAAEAALQTAKSSERTQVNTAECRDAFDALVAKMRFIKNHWFLQPPLTDAELVSLSLSPHDNTKTEVPAPRLEAEGDVRFPDYGIIEVTNIRARGDMGAEDKRAYRGVRIYYGLTGTPTPQDLFRLSEAPAAGYQLPHSIWTQRKNHRFAFPGESGNRIYLCLCYENGKGGAGPWGPILTAIVP